MLISNFWDASSCLLHYVYKEDKKSQLFWQGDVYSQIVSYGSLDSDSILGRQTFSIFSWEFFFSDASGIEVIDRDSHICLSGMRYVMIYIFRYLLILMNSTLRS